MTLGIHAQLVERIGKMTLPHRESSIEQECVRNAFEMAITIAVLSSDFSNTVAWIKNNFEITEINLARRRVVLKDGRILYIISQPEQAYGMRFSEYIKAPDYSTLEDVVRSRCY